MQLVLALSCACREEQFSKSITWTTSMIAIHIKLFCYHEVSYIACSKHNLLRMTVISWCSRTQQIWRS